MTRPAAIVLTPRLPWPLDDGGRIAAFQTLWAAAQTHDVTLITFVPAGTEGEPPPRELRAMSVEVVPVPHRPPAVAAAAVSGLVGRWPFTLARYRRPEFARVLRKRVAMIRPAYALVNHLHMAPYIDELDGVPMVLRQHNVEHVWMERVARDLGMSPAGVYAGIQASRLRKAEAKLCHDAALTLAIQDEETKALRALAPGARVETLPLGVDLDRYLEPRPVSPAVVLLAASFTWKPNVDGAIRFLEEGWPRLRAEAPGARLRIAGKAPPPDLVAAARLADVEVAADVPSMPEEFARATMLLVPLWVGAGARVKVVEALAARLPVISTSMGSEGLGLTPGVHFLEADAPGALAARAAELLRDPARREALARAGRERAEERWALPTVARLQNELIDSVVK
jgi:glycosyltransferase involved in cell wall biosynthesis